MLHLTALDALTRRFRERMAANLVANPVEEQRLEEMQLTPPVPVAEAVDALVETILDDQGVVEL